MNSQLLCERLIINITIIYKGKWYSPSRFVKIKSKTQFTGKERAISISANPQRFVILSMGIMADLRVLQDHQHIEQRIPAYIPVQMQFIHQSVERIYLMLEGIQGRSSYFFQ